MRRAVLALALGSVVTACGDDGGSSQPIDAASDDGATIDTAGGDVDAAPGIDAPSADAATAGCTPRPGTTVALAPELVIANQEENTRPALERLAERVPVLVSMPRRVADGVAHVARLARALDVARTPAAIELVRRGYEACAAPPPPVRARAFVPIWMDPLMTMNADTFGADVLAAVGIGNAFDDRLRLYPLAADLGKAAAAELDGPGGVDASDLARDAALDWLYGRDAALGERDERGADLSPSTLAVPEWINQIHALFPRETIERLERDAVEEFGLHEVVTNKDVLARIEPSETLLRAVLLTKHLMSAEVLGLARELVRRCSTARCGCSRG